MKLALLRTLRVYCTAGWIYIACNAVSHPRTLHMRLTHFYPWPTELMFGIACFLLSTFSFVVLGRAR